MTGGEHWPPGGERRDEGCRDGDDMSVGAGRWAGEWPEAWDDTTDMPVPSRMVPGMLEYLDDVRVLLATASRDSWWPGPTYPSPDGMRHCCLSHIHTAMGPAAMDRFEAQWSSVHVIGTVNDGTHPDYPQDHPRERVLAFLDDLRSGVVADTRTSMELDHRAGVRIV
jgi:hypothetical protein